jgi:hypothetical protein
MSDQVDVERAADGEPLLVAVWAGVALGVVTALTLLVSGHFGQRWFLLVFLGPVLVFLALGAVRGPRRTDGRHAARGD